MKSVERLVIWVYIYGFPKMAVLLNHLRNQKNKARKCLIKLSLSHFHLKYNFPFCKLKRRALKKCPNQKQIALPLSDDARSRFSLLTLGLKYINSLKWVLSNACSGMRGQMPNLRLELSFTTASNYAYWEQRCPQVGMLSSQPLSFLTSCNIQVTPSKKYTCQTLITHRYVLEPKRERAWSKRDDSVINDGFSTHSFSKARASISKKGLTSVSSLRLTDLLLGSG